MSRIIVFVYYCTRVLRTPLIFEVFSVSIGFLFLFLFFDLFFLTKWRLLLEEFLGLGDLFLIFVLFVYSM